MKLREVPVGESFRYVLPKGLNSLVYCKTSAKWDHLASGDREVIPLRRKRRGKQKRRAAAS